MNIGLLALARSTFDIEYANQKLDQCMKFLLTTKHNIFGKCQLLLDAAETLDEIDGLKSKPIDFILILQITFTDALMTLKIGNYFDKPMGIWAFPEPRLGGRLRLNAFCGLNLASHSLGLNNIQFSWLYEDPGKIKPAHFDKFLNKENVKKKQAKARYVRSGSKMAKSITSKISNFKIGKIGHHPLGFDTCKYDPEKIQRLYGIKVEEIKLNSFFKTARTIPKKSIETNINELKNQLYLIENVNQKELERSLELKAALQQIKNSGAYDAFAIRCWPEMFTEYGGAICAPAAIMTENKIPCACEADVYGSITQLILQEVSNQPVFLTDIVDMDIYDNTGVFWHCGQAPMSMCDADFKPRATIHTNRKMPLLFEFPLKAGTVTIMRVSQSFGKHKMLISKGTILRRKMPFTGTSGVIRFDRNTADVLHDIISSGLEHHVAITYGNHVKLLSEVANELDLPVLYI